MLKTYTIPLDIEKELYSPSILLFSISRNDLETVELTFTISQDDTRLNLTGTTVELAIKKPSGLTVYQTCEIIDEIQGEVKVLLSNQAYVEYGIYMAEIYVKDIDQIAVTSPFWYLSRAAVMEDDTIESTNEWSAFQMALFAYDLKPIVTSGFPTNTPEYVGQMAFDAINKIAYIANDLTNVSWQEIGTGEGGGAANDTVLDIVVPTIQPARIGQLYIDTAAKAAYIATGATTGDWEQIDIGGLTSVDWGEITNKPIVFPIDLAEPTLVALFAAKADVNHNHDLAYAPIVHDHLSADITDLNTVVDGKITTALAGYTPTIPTEYLTDVEGNAAYAPIVHNHDAAYYKKTETYNTGEIDDIVTGITQGGGTVVTDDLTSNSATAALSANQGRILKGEVDAKADIAHNHDAAYAPIVHNHVIGDITNLQTTLDAKADDSDLTTKADVVHTHIIANVTGLQAALDNKSDITHNHDLAYAPIVHNHLSADITDLNTVVDGKITSALAGYTPIIPEEYLTDVEGNAAYAPIVHNHDAAYAPIVHDHIIADVTGLQAAIDAKANTTHNHAITDITNLQTTLDAKADDSDLTTKADVVHTHTIANVTGLQAAIDGKADSVHTHTIANVTGLQAALDGKTTTAYADAGDNVIINTILAGLKLWSGTQAAYDAIGTKNSTTLYFITG